jgi:hypothetical protein
VATGIFFFLGGDLYSTIVLPNAFAVRGVVQALGESGNLDLYASPPLPLIATAIAAIVVLIIADVPLASHLSAGCSASDFRSETPNHPISTFVAHSDRIATIGWTAVARRAAGRPARSATETAIVEAST